MLQAVIKKKLKHSFSDPHFTPSEDSLTSSVIGLLQYLPDDTIWQLLKSSCADSQDLPNEIGEIKSFNFWERMMPDEEYNSSLVEPDVRIECEKYDIIIEAKKQDGGGQYEEQWWKEIVSYNKTLSENKKELIFIALSGNISLESTLLEIEGKGYKIFKSSWYTLLNEVDRYRGKQPEMIRLLNDIIVAFAAHKILCTNWLQMIEHRSISKTSINNISNHWRFDNKALLANFYSSNKSIARNNIFESWKLN